MTNPKCYPCMEADDYIRHAPIQPERRLMAAMLEHAIRDLYTGGDRTRDAIDWFRSPRTKCIGCIPYLVVVSYLELGKFCTDKIEAMIEEVTQALRVSDTEHEPESPQLVDVSGPVSFGRKSGTQRVRVSC